MTVTVGRLRPCNVLDWKFVLLSHNTVRGAAGATILNAEMLASLGKLGACSCGGGARVEIVVMAADEAGERMASILTNG
jgi:aspartate-semialdehyde dehydrogenase